MKSIFFLSWFLCVSVATWAQSRESITQYFDEHWKKTDNKQSAAFYRTVEDTATGFVVRDYFISGKIQMKAYCIETTPDLVHDGKTSIYYENGRVKSESWFKDDKQVGFEKTYYESGKPRLVLHYEPDQKTKYIHFWSIDGNELLAEGQGTVTPDPTRKNDSYLDIQDSFVVANYSVTESDTIYTVCEKMPEYGNGLEQMYKDISRNVQYPKGARRKGIQGIVYVGFVIDKRGNVQGCKVIKGIEEECDEQAKMAVCKLDKWHPATHNGKPVKIRFVLPVKFKLSW